METQKGPRTTYRKTKKRPSKKVIAMRINQAKRFRSNDVRPNAAPAPSIPCTSATDIPEPGTSERKITLFTDFITNNDIPKDTCYTTAYTLVHNSVWDVIMKGLLCSECGKDGIGVDIQENLGFSSKLIIICRNCGYEHSNLYSSPRINDKNSQRPPFQVNNDMVEAFVEIGKGHSALEKFSLSIGMNTLGVSSYTNLLNRLIHEGEMLKQEILNIDGPEPYCSKSIFL